VEAGRRFAAWVAQASAPPKRLVVLEIGAGFNTPGVIRGRDEAIVAAAPGARLIRVNADAAQVPAALVDADRSAQVFGDAAAAVARLFDLLGS